MYTLLLRFLPRRLAQLALTVWYFTLLLLITKYATSSTDAFRYGGL